MRAVLIPCLHKKGPVRIYGISGSLICSSMLGGQFRSLRNNVAK